MIITQGLESKRFLGSFLMKMEEKMNGGGFSSEKLCTLSALQKVQFYVVLKFTRYI